MGRASGLDRLGIRVGLRAWGTQNLNRKSQGLATDLACIVQQGQKQLQLT